jgi:hypothetical protein
MNSIAMPAVLMRSSALTSQQRPMRHDNDTTTLLITTIPDLLDLCHQYVVAGWITSEQYHNYQHLLRKHPDTFSYIAQEIQTTITSNHSHSHAQHSSLLHPTTTATAITKSKSSTHVAAATTTQRVSWGINEQRQLPEPSSSNQTIFLPNEFHTILQSEMYTDRSFKELFVEMCFYARLGYIQPPCCLHCSYQRATSTTAPNHNSQVPICSRWVVWRINANIILHPDTIHSNIVFLPCHVAQQFLLSSSSSSVDGYHWDHSQKLLIYKE